MREEERERERKLEEAARAMLKEKHIPTFYWAEVVRTIIYTCRI